MNPGEFAKLVTSARGMKAPPNIGVERMSGAGPEAGSAARRSSRALGGCESAMRTLRGSLYIAVPILFLLAWVGCGIAVSVAVPVSWAGAHGLVLLVVSVIVGIGGLISCWWIDSRIRFWRGGKRIMYAHLKDQIVGPRGPHAIVYEEFTAEGRIQRLHLVGEIFEDETPNRGEIRVPSAERWDTQVPSWARGWRAEILARIDACAGPRNQFVDEELHVPRAAQQRDAPDRAQLR